MNREQNEKGVEVHKTPKSDVMVLVYADASTVALLANP